MSDLVANFLDAKAWDDFIARHAGPDGGWLQSWSWGEVQRAFGRPVRRLALLDGGTIVAGWQVIALRLPLRQSSWYCPHPVALRSSGHWPALVQSTASAARKASAIFFRLDDGSGDDWSRLGLHPAAGAVQPPAELIIDVRSTADALFAAMKPKTRYNIRLGQKHGVTVESVPLTAAGFQPFWDLIAATARRQRIRTHAPAYYRAMLAVLAKTGQAHLLIANIRGDPLAAALLYGFNGVLNYLHGGSGDAKSELMAPYVLHWEAITLAQRLGLSAYNFGGVSAENPAWAGMTRFKQGFAPATPPVRYGGLWELGIKPWRYRAYQAILGLRAKRKK